MSENTVRLCVRHDFGPVPMDGLITIYEGDFKSVDELNRHIAYFLKNFPAPLLIEVEMLHPIGGADAK